MLINHLADDRLGDMPITLAEIYGASGSMQNTETRWTLPSGVTAKLDNGAAVMLVVHGSSAAVAPASMTNPAVSASAGTR